MDPTRRYLELCRRGKAAFLGEAAAAALVRQRIEPARASERASSAALTATFDPEDTTVADPFRPRGAAGGDDLDVFPLAKKPGAPFSDMITVGRTSNNDVVVNDITVSRFHAYFRCTGARWVVSDGGSRNGTRVGETKLEPRRERDIDSGAVVRLGDIETTFYTADDLFAYLSGLPGR